MSFPPELQYQLDPSELGRYGALWSPLQPDEETESWLREFGSEPHGRVKTWFVDQLARFMSVYDAHGFTRSYPMHLLSRAQWRELVGGPHDALLDVGAGGGYVTEYARPWFTQIVCTEISKRLAARLEALDFVVHPHDLLEVPVVYEHSFDVISCLNVLDRTSRPVSLLRALRALMRSEEARCLLSVPLPVRAFVPTAGASVSPKEPLPVSEQTFAGACVELCRFFESEGFVIERIARAPYLSCGDAHAPLYVLDDCLWVVRRRAGD